MINWRRSAILKKSRRYAFAPVRQVVSLVETRTAQHSFPAVIANSIPKSGTHLLIQILQAIPGIRDWGLFLASTPSFRFTEVPREKLARRVRGLAAGELVGAHIHYSAAVQRSIVETGAVGYFVYRDPRDIVVSEAHYLSEMNRWHRLHKVFSRLPDPESRIMCAIEGIRSPRSKLDYPDIGARVKKYLAWRDCDEILSIRFEDLVGETRASVVRGIMDFFCTRSSRQFDPQELAKAALRGIDPARSHTFRKGTTGEWRRHFTDAHTARFKDVAGDVLVELGYESDLEW